jgi:hypothetical protein
VPKGEPEEVREEETAPVSAGPQEFYDDARESEELPLKLVSSPRKGSTVADMLDVFPGAEVVEERPAVKRAARVRRKKKK